MDYAIFTGIAVALCALSTTVMKRITKSKGASFLEIMGHTPKVIWGMLVVILAFGWLIVKQGESAELARMKSPLVGLAPVFSHILQDEGHSQLPLHAKPNDALYQKLLHHMEDWIKIYPFMSSVYTMRKLPDGTNVFVLDPEVDYDGNGEINTDLERITPMGEPYLTYIPELEAAFEGMVTFQDEPYTDEWGTFISAFAPIYDNFGNVEAVFGIDLDYAVWAQRLADARLTAMYYLLIPILILLGSFWMAFLHRLKSYEIQLSEDRYRGLLSVLPDAMIVHNGQFLFINHKGLDMLGAKEEKELIGRNVIDFVHPDDQALVLNRIKAMFTTGEAQPLQEIKIVSLEQQIYHVEMAALPIEYKGQPAIQVVARDISEQRKMRAALQKSEERFRKIFEKAGIGIGLRKKSGEIIEINPALEKITGYTRDQLHHIPISAVAVPMQPEDQLYEELIQGKRDSYQIEKLYYQPNGKVVQGILTVSLFPSDDQEDDYIIGMVMDVTQQKEMEQMLLEANERLSSLSSLDGLTGIANRRTFDERMEAEWQRAVRNSSPLSLIMLDIDQFKAYNDTYGHLEGDECLKLVASTIRGVLNRSADIVCRYGGEEFAVILPETDETGSVNVAEKIRAAIESLQMPHIGSTVSEWVTISLGTASMIPTLNGSFFDLILAADKALYVAKQEGRNRVRTYNKSGIPTALS